MLLSLRLSWAEAASTPPWYYVLENLSSKTVVQRGTTTTAGFRVNELILVPNTRYRQWILNGATGEVGYRDFVSSEPGLRTIIPPIPYGPSHTPDLDGDGLSGEAEFILGSDARKADTDGDGISDGAAARLGLGTGGIPLGVANVVGTGGPAVDACAFNDLVAVAEGEGGVSVFNVFNGMRPILVGRLATPAPATHVSFSGPMLAVAAGEAGLCLVDLGEIPNLRLRFRVSAEALGGEVVALATSGGVAYVGTIQGLSVVDLASGTVLRTDFSIGPVEDLVETDDTLHLLTPSQLRVLASYEGGLTNRGSLYVDGEPVPLENRRRLQVADGRAYVGHFRGFTTISVSDPFHPRLIAIPPSTQSAMHDLDLTGSGRLLAMTSFAGEDTLAATFFDVTQLGMVTNLVATFDTPGRPRAAAIYNGIAYVADGEAGLTVLNYLATDRQGKPPTIRLATTLATNAVVETRTVLVVASTSDDVQVRNVEFYVDGAKVATDGSYPFEVRLATPTRAERPQMVVRARVTDTGGNEAWSNEIPIQLLPDTEPPFVASASPGDGEHWLRVEGMTFTFSEAMDASRFDAQALKLVSTGPDRQAGTADDAVVAASRVGYSPAGRTAEIRFATPLAPGLYELEASGLRDLAGNPLGGNTRFRFEVETFEQDPWDTLAADNGTSASLRSDGTVWTWGRVYSESPVRWSAAADHAVREPRAISEGRTFVSLAAGQDFWLAIADDGSLWGWGDNYWGTLGDSNLGYFRRTPTRLMTERRWRRVAASHSHVVAIDSAGSLWAWGSNWNGERGDGTFDRSSTPTRVKVPAEAQWKVVAASGRFAAAISTEGELWAWGDLDILGGRQPTPTRIHADRKWRSLAAAWYNLMAIAEDESLWSGLQNSTRIGPRQLGMGRAWKQISSGNGEHLIGVATDGTLWEWGAEERFRTEDGVHDSPEDPPRQGGANQQWAAVADGLDHSLALATDGTLWSWGVDRSGELGDGMRASAPVPIQLTPGAATAWSQVSCGARHTVALDRDGQAWLWGGNEHHQLGGQDPFARSVPWSPGGPPWARLTAGAFHTLGVAWDGGLWAWGNNLFGQIGDGTSGWWDAARLEPTAVLLDRRTLQESARESSVLAVAEDHTLWAWGDSTSRPEQVGTDGDWKHVATSGFHTLGLREDGRVWSWGRNQDGQLGNGTTSYEPSSEPQHVLLEETVRAVSAGSSHSVAIGESGRLWAWGSNLSGQLGLGTASYSHTPVPVGDDTDWRQVAAGHEFTAGIREDGSLWMWGANLRGELGTGDFTLHRTPVRIGVGRVWQTVSVGSAHCAAITAEGELFLWGANDFGQLGNGAAVLVPVEVHGGRVWGPRR